MTDESKKMREKLITVRVAEDRLAQFKLAAELRGSNMSNLIHQFITHVIWEEKKKHPEEFAGLEINEPDEQKETPEIGETSEIKGQNTSDKDKNTKEARPAKARIVVGPRKKPIKG